MKYEAKTKPENTDVKDYLLSLENPKRQAEGLALLEIFEQETGQPAVLWGGKMIGFGSYDYRYQSGHSGTAFRTGFALGKAKISLYCYLEGEQREAVLSRLGKHTTGVACIYINKLADANEETLRELIRGSWQYMQAQYPKQSKQK